MQIEQESKRTISIPFLGNTEKEAIMREKYLSTMKPVRHVHVYMYTQSNEAVFFRKPMFREIEGGGHKLQLKYIKIKLTKPQGGGDAPLNPPKNYVVTLSEPLVCYCLKLGNFIIGTTQ